MLINPLEYEALKKVAKGRFFELVEKIQRANKDVNPTKALCDINLTVEEVRQETYGKAR